MEGRYEKVYGKTHGARKPEGINQYANYHKNKRIPKKRNLSKLDKSKSGVEKGTNPGLGGDVGIIRNHRRTSITCLGRERQEL